MLEKLTNKYSLSKTMRFSLIPQGKTEQFFRERILMEDENRARNYKLVKQMVDTYHKNYIATVLADFSLSEKLYDLSEMYFEIGKLKGDSKDVHIKNMQRIEATLRTEISDVFLKNPKFDSKILFSKKLIEEELYKIANTEEEINALNSFKNFTTYFTSLHETRKNMYVKEDISTAISYRIINQNLPKFLDNIKVYRMVSELLNWGDLNKLCYEHLGCQVERMFEVDCFNLFMSQKGIDIYNLIIGGYTTEDGIKVQGINEKINLYAQKAKIKLPQMRMLYKQILSDREGVSFKVDSFTSDVEVVEAIYSFYLEKENENELSYQDVVLNVCELLKRLDEFSIDQIYIKNSSVLTDLGKKVYGDWDIFRKNIELEYDKNSTAKKKDTEEYYKVRKKNLDKKYNYSILDLQKYANDSENSLITYFVEQSKIIAQKIEEEYKNISKYLDKESGIEWKRSDDNAVKEMKDFLDSLKDFQHFVSMLIPDTRESNKDMAFYSVYENILIHVNEVTRIYNMVRNYTTQKPFSIEKFKLNFQSPTLLKGFDKNKEISNLSIILRDNKKYYLAIMNKGFNKSFEQLSADGGEYYERMNYKLLPGPNKMLPKVFLSKKGCETFHPSKDLLKSYEKKTHLKGDSFVLEDCHRLIDYFKDCIEKHEYRDYDFEFSDTSSYENVSQFYKEVADQGYKLWFTSISKDYVHQLVEEGKLYLFQIYNKDFSEYSKGTPNLYTLYFKALFDTANLENVVYKLNGEAEIFYRPASILAKKPTHRKNELIDNKNPLNPKKQSEFEYDLYKDKRYMKDQFLFHVPITMNFKAESGNNLNTEVRSLLRKGGNQHIIGIDRGERHLLYVTVIDAKGEIKEQFSLNEIISSYRSGDEEIQTRVDYHSLLDKKEEERKKSRQSWKSVENIKELKAGYLSQVVHKICDLVEKYDAIVVMEDLNSGFKNSRIKVEKQVYQKFEKALIEKLNYWVDKKRDKTELGGVLRAYQCTNKFESFEKLGKQSGIIFYVPAWLTSKVDPVTGFADLLRPKYESVAASKSFIQKIDDIRYNLEEDYFEFFVDYDKFPRTDAMYKKDWVICSYGKRIINERSAVENNQWVSRMIIPTQELKDLFIRYKVDFTMPNIKEQILKQDEKAFYKSFMDVLKVILQMRNSEINSSIDYLISPVKSDKGIFYNSFDYTENMELPANADANGAYNIARKGLWIVEQLQQIEDVSKAKIAMSNKEWMEYIQK